MECHSMPHFFRLGVALAAVSSLSPQAMAEHHGVDDPTALQDVIIITQTSLLDANQRDMRPDMTAPTVPDAAALLARQPGYALVDNGGLSGQVQQRGLFGARVPIRIDGQSFASGGPNLMDPPLHYAPPVLIDHVTMDRGVSPVSKGPGLGGGIDAIFKRIDFADNEDWQTGYDLTATGRSADDSFGLGGVVGASKDDIRLQMLGAVEQGDDITFPDGAIRASEHDRIVFGLGAGYRTNGHEFGLDMRRQETGETGNPPFAMDIAYVDTDFVRAHYRGQIGERVLKASLGYAHVDHLMTNFHLRPAPESPHALAAKPNRLRDADG